MSTIQERLKIIMKTHRLTASSFADRVGVQRSGVSHIMSGRNKPSLDFIQKTLAAFPRVNGDWLVTGRQLKTTTKENDPSEGSDIAKQVNDTNVNSSAANDPDGGVTTVTSSRREIEKVILFYNDGTYDITYPNKKK